MKFLTILLRASIPLFFILFAWLTGTTTKEYWSRFKTVEGELIEPYTVIKIDHELVFNDSIRLVDKGYDELIFDLQELDMSKRLYSITKPRMLKLNSYIVDSVKNPISKEQWLSLEKQHEILIDQVDTVFKNRNGSKEIKVAIWQKMYAIPYFSISGNPDQFTISTYQGKSEEDKYGIKFKIEYGFSKNKKFSTWENLNEYNTYLAKVLENAKGHISVTRLNDKKTAARAYIIKDQQGDEIFNDSYGFEALKYQSEGTGGIDLSEINDRYVLWYDNFFIKFLIVVQILSYAAVGFVFWEPKKNHQQTQ